MYCGRIQRAVCAAKQSVHSRLLNAATALMILANVSVSVVTPAAAQAVFDVNGNPLQFIVGSTSGQSPGYSEVFSNVITIGGTQIDARVTVVSATVVSRKWWKFEGGVISG